MQIIFLIACILSTTVFAKAPTRLGTYSLATEADWGAYFELKKNGRVTVVPWIASGESEDEESEKGTSYQGSWHTTAKGIEITFHHFKDELYFEKNCKNWSAYRCFRYGKSLIRHKEPSPLDQDKPFVDWSSGPKDKTQATKAVDKKAELKDCETRCKSMAAKNELKKGIGIPECIKMICKH